jgi:hypothetical protein
LLANRRTQKWQAKKNRITLAENNGTIIEVIKTDEFSSLIQENEGRVEKIKPRYDSK